MHLALLSCVPDSRARSPENWSFERNSDLKILNLKLSVLISNIMMSESSKRRSKLLSLIFILIVYLKPPLLEGKCNSNKPSVSNKLWQRQQRVVENLVSCKFL